MKKALSLFIALLTTVSLTVPALAYDYKFDGAEQHPFGKSTSTDEVSAAPVNAGEITDKDVQTIPPAFGSPSAYMPGVGEPLTPNLTGIKTGPLPSTGNNVAVLGAPTSASTPTDMGNQFDLPLFYDDGSIGTLRIPALNLNVKVYETESLESLAKGVGHFKSTSAWSGNVGIAGVRPDRALLNVV